MPKRKRKVGKKEKQQLSNSSGLFSEIWEQIVSGLDLPSLVNFTMVYPRDHWGFFYAKHALQIKKLRGIQQALCFASVPRWSLSYRSKGSPDHAKILLRWFSRGCSPKGFQRVLKGALVDHVYAFMLVIESLVIPGGFEIRGLGNAKIETHRQEQKFSVSVKVVLPKNHKGVKKFSPSDYMICVCQPGPEPRIPPEDCPSPGKALFLFFKKFRFNVELHQPRFVPAVVIYP